MENIYVYDSRSRLLSVSASLNGNAPVSLIRNEYDGVGRLKSVTHNGKANLKTEYSYNIRSWVTNMSNPLYSQTLTYGYGGNISSQQWVQDSKTRKYTYTYDGLNRLTHAAYTGDGNYTTNYSYDNMGNITSLKRYDVSLVDNLTYTYNGNQLTKVEDATGNTFGFANGSTATTEYYYDNNGNLTKDLNKNISNIQYNSLGYSLIDNHRSIAVQKSLNAAGIDTHFDNFVPTLGTGNIINFKNNPYFPSKAYQAIKKRNPQGFIIKSNK